jgi:tetratricopeptide (TPR) repeat protein
MAKGNDKMLTTQQVAKRLRKPYSTVSLWVRQGRFPNAVQEETPRGVVWWVPESDVQNFTLPKPGRPTNPAKKTANKRGQKKLMKADAERFFDLTNTAHQKLLGAEQNTWLERLDYERDNLLATLDFYRKHNPAKELEMAVSLGQFWYLHGYWAEGKEILQNTIKRQPPGKSSLKAQGLAWIGYLSLRLDDYRTAKLSLLESIQMSRDIDDKECLAFSLHSLGFVTEAEGDYERAKALFKESIQAGEEAKSSWLVGEAFCGLGIIAEIQGDYPAAKEYYSKYLAKSEDIEDLRGLASALNCLGAVAREQGSYSEARHLHEKSLALRQGMGNKNGMAYCQHDLGLLEETIGNHREACRSFQKSLTLCRETGNKLWTIRNLESIGKMTHTTGKGEDAALIYGAADALRTSIAAPLTPAESAKHGEIITSVKQQFSAQWQEGSEWSLDAAINHALSIDLAHE